MWISIENEEKEEILLNLELVYSITKTKFCDGTPIIRFDVEGDLHSINWVFSDEPIRNLELLNLKQNLKLIQR